MQDKSAKLCDGLISIKLDDPGMEHLSKEERKHLFKCINCGHQLARIPSTDYVKCPNCSRVMIRKGLRKNLVDAKH